MGRLFKKGSTDASITCGSVTGSVDYLLLCRMFERLFRRGGLLAIGTFSNEKLLAVL